MKSTKPISDAKVRANQENARKSTGPRTTRGKNYSRRGALKHRFYAKELLVLDDEKPEFEKHRKELQSQYAPRTAMQWTAFELILTNSWRVKLALRHERGQLTNALGVEDLPTEKVKDTPPDPYLVQWYGSGRLEIRAGLKVLDLASAEYDERGELRDQTKELLTQAFGPEFLDTLTSWRPTNKEAVLMANFLVAHAQNFGEPLYPKGIEPPRTDLDSQQIYQMIEKIINERRNFLLEIIKIRDQEWSAGENRNSARGDFNPGFLKSATAELRRAVDWYVHLQELEL